MTASCCRRAAALTLLLSAFAGAVAVAPAQTSYHVDAVAGNDASGDGSVLSPWQSLSRIPVAGLQPGDHVRLARGSVFREKLEITASGVSGQPIVIEAYGSGDVPVISAGEVIPVGATWAGPDASGEFTIAVGTTTEFYTADLVAVRSAAGGGLDTYVLLGQPPPATTGPLDEDEAYGDAVAGQRILRVKPPAGTHPADFTWEVSKRGFGLRVTGDHVEVENIAVILGNEGHPTQDPPVVTGGIGATGDVVTFRGCRAAFCRTFGLYLEGSSGRIDGCLAEHNRSTGIVLQTAGAQNCTVENSTARFNGNIEEKDFDRGGIGVQGNFATIRGNLVQANGNPGDNTGPRVGGDGAIQLFNCRECVVENNLIVDSVRTAIDMSYDPSSFGHRFVNNVIVNWNLLGTNGTLKTQAITGIGFGDSPDSARLLIANNTIYSDQSAEWLIGIQLGLPTNADTIQNTSVLNNIVFLPNNTNPGSAGMRFTRGHLFYGTVIDHNCVSVPLTNRTYEWSANAGVMVFSTAAAFAANTIACSGDPRCVPSPGHASNDVNGDPRFAFGQPALDPANYALQSSSPAIDAGTAVAGRTADFLGTAVPGGAAPDIGAFESQADRVTYTFSGLASVFDAGNRIGGDSNGFNVPFQGSFSFDLNAPLINPGTTTATYRIDGSPATPLPPNELSITLRGFLIEANPQEDLTLTVQDLPAAPAPGNNTDSFHIRSDYPQVTPAISPPQGHPVSTIDLVFLDSTGVIFTDKSLPTSFDLADFNLEQIVIQYRDPAAAGTVLFQVTGNLDTLTRVSGTADTDPPIVDLTAPADGAITNQASIAVSANVTDASTTIVSSTPAGVSGSLPAGGGTASGAVTLAIEGANTITVSAEDTAGNLGGDSVTVTRDTIAPGVVIVSPAPGAVFGASPITVTVDVSDATATSVQIGASTFPIASGSGQVSANNVALVGGSNTIPVTVTDAAGNVTNDSVTVVLDLTAPLVTIDTPANGACFGPGEETIGVGATVDDLTATTVSSTPAGVSGSLPAGGGIVSGMVALVEGSNAIAVNATDAANRTGSGAVSVILDTTAPSVTIASPGNGDAVGGAIDVDADVIEPTPGSGIASVVFAVDGSAVATLTVPPWGIVYDTAPLNDGAHTVAITATDGKGNSSSSSVSVLVDNTAPSVTIANPADGAVVGGTTPIAVVASDSGSGLVGVTVLVDGAAPTSDPSNAFAPPQASASLSGSEDTTTHPDGPLGMTATAVDAAGNAANDSVQVTVDNTAPQKTLVAPTDGETVSGTLQISAQASDANLASIEIVVDGQTVASSVVSPLTADVDTTLRLDGAMTVAVVVRDLAGNDSTCTATVTVDNMTGRMIPKQLNLEAKKAKGDVQVELEGVNLALLLPTEAHGIALRIPGGSPVPSVQGWGGDDSVSGDKLHIRFDRQAVVNALCAGVDGGAIAPSSIVPIDVVADGLLIETVLVTIKN